MSKLLLILFLASTFAQANDKPEITSVQKMKWVKDKKMYRLTLNRRAGVYYSKTNFYNCLRKSLNGKSKISITYNPKNLYLKSCIIIK